MVSSYLLKSFRAFSKNPVSECMIIFSFAYLSYLFSEVLEASGIISLLTCGVVMAHYSWYNLSPQGKQSSFIVFQFLGYATEAFVFSYLGLTFFSYGELDWSFHLFWAELSIIVFGRFCGVIGLMSFMKLCGYKSGTSLREMVFIWYAGMIRGAIAFGLVLRIDSPNRNVIVTTSLSLVIFTTVVFGSTVGLVSKCLFKEKAIIEEENVDDDANKEKPNNYTPLLSGKKESEAEAEDYESFDESHSESSYHEM